MLRLEIYEDFLSALLPDVFRVASHDYTTSSLENSPVNFKQ